MFWGQKDWFENRRGVRPFFLFHRPCQFSGFVLVVVVGVCLCVCLFSFFFGSFGFGLLLLFWGVEGFLCFFDVVWIFFF